MVQQQSAGVRHFRLDSGRRYALQQRFNRVEGQDLFKKDLNCHCFDSNKDLLLNSAAWVNPDPGKFGVAAAAYSNYRAQRVPDEQLSLGRLFRIREGIS